MAKGSTFWGGDRLFLSLSKDILAFDLQEKKKKKKKKKKDSNLEINK